MTTKNIQSVECPHCGEKNTFKNSELLNLFNLICKKCDENLLAFYEQPFLDISSQAFTHKLDTKMLEALKKIPGIDTILKTLLRHSLELSMRLHHQANYIQASPKQLKSLYKQLEQAAYILNIDELPELYVSQDSHAHAYTFGVEKCSIAISSGCLDLMSPAETLCVLAHELGHIKARHVLYKTATRVLSAAADSIAQKTLGMGGVVLMPIKLALLRWDRASELSSDRAALLVVKNPTILLTTLMKLAGASERLKSELNIQAFISQAQNYEKTQEEGLLGSYIGLMNTMFNSHPLPIWRAQEIIEWVHSGDYLEILRGNYIKNKKLDTPKPSSEGLEKTVKDFRSWLEKNISK